MPDGTGTPKTVVDIAAVIQGKSGGDQGQHEPLKATTSFPYLVRTVTYNNSDLVALYSNLQEDKMIWGMVAKVLGKTGVPIKSTVMMYKGVVQALLLYVKEIWLVTDSMMVMLEVFNHKIARRIVGMTSKKKGDSGECEWNLVDAALEVTRI